MPKLATQSATPVNPGCSPSLCLVFMGTTKGSPKLLPSQRLSNQSRPRRRDPGGYSPTYPCTETPANDSSATPRTGCPNHSAGSNLLDSKSVSSSARVPSSLGPDTMS